MFRSIYSLTQPGDSSRSGLDGFVLPQAKEWQTGDQVHFNALGNQQLGQRVSEKILEALDRKKP